MSLPVRPTMRLLSERLRHLQRLPATPLRAAVSSQLRASSRYSSPAKRSEAYNAAAQASFTPTSDTSTVIDSVPSDVLGVQEARQKRSANQEYQKKKNRYLIVGLIFSIAGTAWTCREIQHTVDAKEAGLSLDSSKEETAKFQGKEVHVIGVGEGKRIVAEDQAGAVELVETGTSSVPHFPKTIYLPTATDSSLDPNALAGSNTDATPGNRANLEEYTLVGLGIRSVSFLSIQVYVVGMYVRTTDITGLQARLIHHINPAASTLIPSEKEDLKAKLLDNEGSRELWDSLLETPGMKTAWRVVPTRNTDFMHLRDGWITGINKRTAEAKKRDGNVPSEYDREDFGLAVRSFMSIFKGGKAPKGSIMVLSRNADGGLSVFFTPKSDADGKDKETQLLGRVEDERLGKLIWMNYLAGDKVSSEAARQGVADGCVAMASRPVGSVETMVA